jgi:hypothetical protein
MLENHEHHCDDPEGFPLNGFLQRPCTEKGAKVLIVGEALAPNGWRKSGQACYDVNGKRLKTGENLNTLLRNFDLNVESCGFTDLAKCYVGNDARLKREIRTGDTMIFRSVRNPTVNRHRAP